MFSSGWVEEEKTWFIQISERRQQSPPAPDHFLFPFLTRGGWNLSAEAVLQTAFKATLEVNYIADIETSWFLACSLLVLCTDNFLCYPSPQFVLHQDFCGRVGLVMGCVCSSNEKCFLTSRSLFTRLQRAYPSVSFSLYHFTLGKKTFPGGAEQWHSLLCRCKTPVFELGGRYFLSRLSRGLQLQRLPVVGVQPNARGSRSSRAGGQVCPPFSAPWASPTLLCWCSLQASLLGSAAALLLHP